MLALATTFVCASALPPTSAHAAERCVGKPHGCHATLQAALDAAGDGDTIRIKAGTHAGGATVTKSVTLAGAGQHATTLSGGRPVLAIGTGVVSIRPDDAISPSSATATSQKSR